MTRNRLLVYWLPVHWLPITQFMKIINILGVKVDNHTYNEVLQIIEQFLNSERTESRQITTVNPEFIMTAQKDKDFREIINRSFISTVDGAGIVWATDFLYGKKIKQRVTGVDLIEKLAKLAKENGSSIFFLGAQPGVAEKTAATLEEKNPGLKIAGTYAGSPKDEDQEKILKLINNSQPDILLVAYGAPAQDKWIYDNLKNFEKPLLAIGIGGSFDYIAGVVKRAPLWMRKAGLEWLYRLVREPKRYNRILTASVRFPLAVMRSKK